MHLEIGLQSFNPKCWAPSVARRTLTARRTTRFLRRHTHAFLHADLIAGLPGETPESFAAGFDQLCALQPHEIQLGILKNSPARLSRGMTMPTKCAIVLILPTTFNPRATGRRIIRAHRAHGALVDAIVSSNRHRRPHLEGTPSIFAAFLTFSDWLDARFPEHGVPLAALVEAMFEYLTTRRGIAPDIAAEALIRGYRHTGARDIPGACPHLPQTLPPHPRPAEILRRQFLRWTWEEETLHFEYAQHRHLPHRSFSLSVHGPAGWDALAQTWNYISPPTKIGIVHSPCGRFPFYFLRCPYKSLCRIGNSFPSPPH